MRDIIQTPVFEVRLQPVSIGDQQPVATEDAVEHLEVIRNVTEPTTEPREPLPGEVFPEGQQPQKVTEKEVPISRERALSLFSERTNGRDTTEGEGVFEVILRENGDVFQATRIDSASTAELARQEESSANDVQKSTQVVDSPTDAKSIRRGQRQPVQSANEDSEPTKAD